jgi:hypothetical protein
MAHPFVRKLRKKIVALSTPGDDILCNNESFDRLALMMPRKYCVTAQLPVTVAQLMVMLLPVTVAQISQCLTRLPEVPRGT